MAQAAKWPFLDHGGPIAFAHRGGAAGAIENSMAAFAASVEIGYTYVETDVRATVDNKCVVFHDETFERLTGRRARIGDLTWREVREIDVRGEPVPTLEEALRTWPHVRFNIDAKEDAVVEPLVDVLARVRAHDRVCLGAFSGARLARLRRLTGSRVCTILSPGDTLRLRLGTWGLPLRPKAGQAVQVPLRYGRVRFDEPRFVDRAHSLGLQVHYWTIDDTSTMRRLLDLGADGIMTDRPAALKQVLQARGQWR